MDQQVPDDDVSIIRRLTNWRMLDRYYSFLRDDEAFHDPIWVDTPSNFFYAPHTWEIAIKKIRYGLITPDPFPFNEAKQNFSIFTSLVRSNVDVEEMEPLISFDFSLSVDQTVDIFRPTYFTLNYPPPENIFNMIPLYLDRRIIVPYANAEIPHIPFYMHLDVEIRHKINYF